MAVGRISGPLLRANLERNGIDLAVETSLLYIDVNNNRIGVNTSSPGNSLQVAGTAESTSVLTGLANIDNVTIDNSTITTATGDLFLTGATSGDRVFIDDIAFNANEIFTAAAGQDLLINTQPGGSVIINDNLTIADPSVASPELSYGSITLLGETNLAEISTNETNLDLFLRADGNGWVQLDSDSRVIGNLEVTGDIFVGGNVTIGDATTDSITIAADFTSDLRPDASNTYDLGTGSKKWRDLYVGDLLLTSNSVTTTVDNGNVRITPDGDGQVIADTTKSFRVPLGTTAERPVVTDPGHIRWNTDINIHEGWDGFEWRPISFGQIIKRHYFTASAGQTVFSGNDDTATEFRIVAGTEFVTKNGQVLEKNEEYSVTNTVLTLTSPASAGDNINVVSFGMFDVVGDYVRQSTGGTFNGGITVGGNLSVLNNSTITANLVVNGTSSYINSTNVAIRDRIVSIGGASNGGNAASDDNQDRGINFKWHDGSSAKNGFFGFDDSTGYFTFIPDATITGEVVSGTPGDIQATNFRGNLISPNVESGSINASGDVNITGRLDTEDYVSFNHTSAVRVPIGTSAERPSPEATGQLRFNTDLVAFEGYNGTAWGTLGGVIDTDRDTYIVAEDSPGADNNELEFFVSGTRELLIDSTGLTLRTQLPVDQGGTGVRTFTTNGVLFGNGTGALQVTAASNPGSNATTSYGILSTDANNVPQWTDTIDGGSY